MPSYGEVVSAQEARLVDELVRFLSIPSVSTRAGDCRVAAEYLARRMAAMGGQVEVFETGGNPVVFAVFGPSTAHRQILVYGHYDVQPPDPIDAWETDPFRPIIRNGRIIARGATDDKGNLLATVEGLRLVLETGARLRVRIAFVFEGEEEIGSPHLGSFLDTQASRLHSDICLLCDRGVHESGRPQIYLGVKGMVQVRVRVRGPYREVHSSQAPLIPNPIWDLLRLLAGMRDDRGRVLIPGFADSVRDPGPVDYALIAGIPFSETEYCSAYGVRRLLQAGSAENKLVARCFTPTCNVSGIHAGYTGPGTKTIIPPQAEARLDFRLVPDQTASGAASCIERFLVESASRLGLVPGVDLDWEVTPHFDPYRADAYHAAVQEVIHAARVAYGAEPVIWPLVDGSGPLAQFSRAIGGGPAILLGLGTAFERANTHAPNEYIELRDYLAGVKMMATYFAAFTDGP